MSLYCTQKPHAVCVPFPSEGHVNPFMQLAKLLHCKGIHITFVNTEFNHRRLIRSHGPETVKGQHDFQFETIPDGLPPSDVDATQDVPTLCDSTQKNCLAPFKELLKKLISSSPGVPPVSCIIADGATCFAIKAAKELGIPSVQFWTTSACGFQAYLQFDELVKRGIVPFKDESSFGDGTLDKTIDWIPGMKDIRLRDMPNHIKITDLNRIMFNFMGSEAQYCWSSSSIIFNTFQELESEVLDAIEAKNPNLYTIGPLHLLGSHFSEKEPELSVLSLWKNDTKCLKWLDKWEPNSVIYVNYGSITVMSEQHLKEFAWGLANSKHPFLWIVRPDMVKGEEYANLPQEFLDEVKDRGYIASWCPQTQVLAHPSIGVFLSHCGWNSTIESIAAGVPMICWPFFAEQQTNCRYACTTWGLGMEVNDDVKREEIEALVNEAIKGDKGKEMRQKGLEWKEKAKKATDIEGSSYNDLNRFLEGYLQYNV
ncbi:hypothetical protein L6164_029160 [Bauhinia variegata]|uniref:Uncharacterized protein n=1 Tax=Bauhinia variegata TaxID=167791 RepID=A0ACB9L8V3_BAUVA|nr:hypothetical protein L6164_029160 [Bauhinia variegata]